MEKRSTASTEQASTASTTTSKLIKIIKDDNIKMIEEILYRKPNEKVPTTTSKTNTRNDDNDNNKTTATEEKKVVDWKQCILFGDKYIQDIISRCILNDTSKWNTSMFNSVSNSAKAGDGGVTNSTNTISQYPMPDKLGIAKISLLDDLFVKNRKQGGGEVITKTGTGLLETEVIFTGSGSTTGGTGMNSNTATNFERDSILQDNLVEMNDPSIDVVIIFLRPNLHQTKLVTYVLKSLLSQSALLRQQKKQHAASGNTQYRLVYLPHCNSLCERILFGDGTLSVEQVSLEEMPIDLIPLDTDVFSLEMPHALKECDVDGCSATTVLAVARSIHKLQTIAGSGSGGVIPRLQGLGPLAEAVIEKLMMLRIEEQKDEEEGQQDGVAAGLCSNGDISAILIMDRKVDLVTPMVMPLTYEALIDEFIGIDCGFVKVDSSIVQTSSGSAANNDAPQLHTPSSSIPKQVSLALNSNDALYTEVRCQNVVKFGSFLQNQAKALKEHHANFTKRDTDLSQIHAIVKQIPMFTQKMRSLTLHIHLAELVKRVTDESKFNHQWHTERNMIEGEVCYDALEDMIAYSESNDVYTVLRLLCLQSLTAGGIKSAKFDSLRRELIQTYGIEYLPLLQNLEKIGAIKRSNTLTWTGVSDASSSSFRTLRTLLILVNADVSTTDPNDFAYVSSGYAPLTIRLLQAASQGWAGKEDALRELPGRLIDILQSNSTPDTLEQAIKRCGTSLTGLKLGSRLPSTIKQPSTSATTITEGKPLVVVYFVGGVTYVELAAIRFLNQRLSFPFEIVCCTTKIFNGTTLLQSLI